MQEMVEGHERALKWFENHSKTTSNVGLKAITTETATSEKKHLEDARPLMKDLK